MQKRDRVRSAACRLELQEPTSHEVGMQNATARGADCRLEHHEPTSHEVGMRDRVLRPFPVAVIIALVFCLVNAGAHLRSSAATPISYIGDIRASVPGDLRGLATYLAISEHLQRPAPT